MRPGGAGETIIFNKNTIQEISPEDQRDEKEETEPQKNGDECFSSGLQFSFLKEEKFVETDEDGKNQGVFLRIEGEDAAEKGSYRPAPSPGAKREPGPDVTGHGKEETEGRQGAVSLDDIGDRLDLDGVDDKEEAA